MDQRHHQSLAAQRQPLVGFAREQVLVRGGELVRERQAGLRGLQRVTGQRMASRARTSARAAARARPRCSSRSRRAPDAARHSSRRGSSLRVRRRRSARPPPAPASPCLPAIPRCARAAFPADWPVSRSAEAGSAQGKWPWQGETGAGRLYATSAASPARGPPNSGSETRASRRSDSQAVGNDQRVRRPTPIG